MFVLQRIMQKAKQIRVPALSVVLIALFFGAGCGSILPSPTQTKTRFSLASFQGKYTYTLGGTIFGLPQGYGTYHEAGSLVADGNGGLSGVDDFSSGSNVTNGPLTGSYTINADGTGSMTINAPGRQIQLTITMRTNADVYLLEVDAFATGDGEALAQTSTGSLSGAYVFRAYSLTVGGSSSTSVGRMMITGTSLTGDEDVSQVGTSSSHTFTGTVTQPDTTGRGTINLTDDSGNSSSYIYYTINSGTLTFIATGTNIVGEGRGSAQTSNAFTNASIQNGFVLRLGGDTQKYIGGLHAIGAFACDGKGNITSGSMDSIMDATAATNETFTGTYSVDSRGRASITFTPAGGSPISSVAWMADSTQAFFLQQAQNSVAAGSMNQQQGVPFSNGSLNGEYSFRMFGFDGQNPTAAGAVGVITFDGKSNVTFADYFANQGGQQSQKAGVSGTYTVSANGRAVSGPINGVTNSMVIYLISNTDSYFLLTDTGTDIQGQNGLQSPQ